MINNNMEKKKPEQTEESGVCLVEHLKIIDGETKKILLSKRVK